MPATREISRLYDNLKIDEARRTLGFSAELLAVTETMLSAATKDVSASALNGWIQRFQPCLFGRLAARFNMIHYCILTEQDLLRSDEEISSLIQAERKI